MVSLKAIKKGGKSGPPIIPGDPENSLMIKRITLDKSNPERMPPPDSSDPLPEKEINLLIEWIRQGAKK